MSWLLRRGEVLASVDRTRAHRDLAKGYARRTDDPAAVLFDRPTLTHTLAARRPLDVAYLDEDLVVLATKCLAPLRVSMPSRGCRSVLVVGGGAFSRWTLVPGDQLELRD